MHLNHRKTKAKTVHDPVAVLVGNPKKPICWIIARLMQLPPIQLPLKTKSIQSQMCHADATSAMQLHAARILRTVAADAMVAAGKAADQFADIKPAIRAQFHQGASVAVSPWRAACAVAEG